MLRWVLCLPLAHALSFHLEGNAERCIGETVPAKSLLAGDWLCSHHNGSDSHSATLTIRSPFDAIVFEKHDASGHFAITAAVNGVHRVCIFNNATSPRRMTINIKTALEVSDHSTVAKKEHVDAIEAELDRMRKMAVHVYEEMLYMRTRSETMQATSESMRGRLLWVELVMMCIVMIMGLWQIQYLKRYFQVKKLI